jgi:hypothetical protein
MPPAVIERGGIYSIEQNLSRAKCPCFPLCKGYTGVLLNQRNDADCEGQFVGLAGVEC